MSKIYDKEYGLPSQYLLNRKKRPAKTDGKFLYYYVGASITDFPKASKLRRYKNAYVCEVEVSSKEWDCFYVLDKRNMAYREVWRWNKTRRKKEKIIFSKNFQKVGIILAFSWL